MNKNRGNRGPNTPWNVPNLEPKYIRDEGSLRISAETIKDRVHALGYHICSDVWKATNGTKDMGLTVVTALWGGLPFYADLLRNLRRMTERGGGPVNPGDLNLEQGLFRCRAYDEDCKQLSNPEVRPCETTQANIEGRYVLFVDDMLDTGHTADAVIQHLNAWGAAKVKTAFLCHKRHTSVTARVTPDYVGFSVPNRWLVGYGMDDRGMRRYLPYIVDSNYYEQNFRKGGL